jgi:hypothetical protein
MKIVMEIIKFENILFGDHINTAYRMKFRYLNVLMFLLNLMSLKSRLYHIYHKSKIVAYCIDTIVLYIDIYISFQ